MNSLLTLFRCQSAAYHAHAARRASLDPSYRAQVLRRSAERAVYEAASASAVRVATGWKFCPWTHYPTLRPYEGSGGSTSLGHQFLEVVLRRHLAARTDLELWTHIFGLRLRKKTGGVLVWGAAFDLVWARRLRSIIQLLLLRRETSHPRIPPAS